MTRPIAQASVAGDFSRRTPIVQHGRTYQVSGNAPGYAISVARDPAAPENFHVDATLGARRFQGYLSKLSDGRLYVLPLFWHVEWKRWLDWKEIAPVPDSNAEVRQIWNVNCFNCHATNIQRNFDVPTRTFATSVTEMGVGCEACHGSGGAHVDVMTAWTLDPSKAPPSDLRIFAPRTATPRQVYEMCAYCHGNKTNYFTDFSPGDRLEDFAQLSLPSDPIPASDPQGEFWPDGRPSRFNRPQALTLSGCFRSGQLSCASCHSAHGSANDHSLKVAMADSDALCTQCHRAFDGGNRARHTHHAETSAGSRCIECHMSEVNWRLLTRRRDHTFAPPVPEMTAGFGVPNACTTCHDEKPPEWAAAVMDRWYGDGPRRRSALDVADAIYNAGSGNAPAIPGLTRIAFARGSLAQGAALRASAAAFIGRLSAQVSDTTASVNALIGAAADPEPMVRVAAVRALGALGNAKAMSALAARLVDSSRVVRVSAAEALLHIGVARLEGAAGLALERAQDEYAQSLAAFPDAASRHLLLGWLRASQGRAVEASAEWRVARELDPSLAPNIREIEIAVARHR
jgi:predicted CXXCH cytochrome family protein